MAEKGVEEQVLAMERLRFSTSFWAEKKQETFLSDFLLGVPLCGRRVFSCKSSGQVDPM